MTRVPESPKTLAAVAAEGIADPDVWELRLYVAGKTARSVAAFENLSRLCDEHLAGKYHIEVVDLLVHPQLASGDQIVAIPTLVRKLPSPIRKVIGDLSNVERTLVGLQLRPNAIRRRTIMDPDMTRSSMDDLQRRNEELARRLEEAEDALRALGSGEVDAILVEGPEHKVFTLEE